MDQIRPIAICVFHNSNRILVFEGQDPVKGETFYRPLGGGIEFGESSEATIRQRVEGGDQRRCGRPSFSWRVGKYLHVQRQIYITRS